ncbi:hypothetical protein EM308_14495 [Flavobacterium gilvum]|uniref:O-antigen ligase-related domain-containing protein n=2 Tax=Flavobacterium gilvum TaxID=1492737 RepID=A0AAC9N782_9FLAO|nr:hypothetical protein EM308_14495 [Flavobacterium gilvum]KFC57841.1 hypothetical protein FEM08_33700 [Flavobacterium gilvum]
MVFFSFSKLDVSLFLLVGYIILNRYVIQTYFGFSIRYLELVGLSFLYVILRNISLANSLWLLLTIVISGIFQAVYGNLQLLGYCISNHSGFKMTGSFFNPGPYAGFLVSVWSVALGMYLFKIKIISQLQSQTKNDSFLFNEFIKKAFEYIPLLGLISIAIVLPATQSRAAWIAAIASSVILMELRYRFLSNLFRKATIKFQKTAIVLFSVGILSTGLFSIYHYKKSSSDGRIFIWKVTTEMIADTPVFGVGFDRFKTHYMNYQANYFEKNRETRETMVADNTYYAFNEFLQFIVENGLIGFMFLMVTAFILFKVKAKEDYKYLSLVAKTGLFGIAVFACFSYPMQILPIKLVLVFLVSTLSNIDGDTYQLKYNQSKERSWAFKTVILVLGAICIYQTNLYASNLNKGFIVWENALNSHQYGDYNEAISAYKSVYTVFNRDGDFLMNYGKTLAIVGEYHKAIEVLKQAKCFLNTSVIETSLGDSYKAIKQYNKAEAAYQNAINMIPSHFYPNYLLAKFYDDSGQEQKAVVLAQKILSKKIKIPSTAIDEIHEEMREILVKNKKPLGFKN